MTRANADGRLFESLATFAERALNDFPADKHIAPLERSAEVALPVTFPRINSNGDSAEYDAPASARTFYANDITYWKRVCDDFDSKQLQARRANVDGEARREAQESVREL